MKKHIAEDLPARKHPQAQLSQSNKPEKKDSGEKGGDDGAEKTPEQKIRQAVYDIRYRARRENLPLRTAYSQYMQNSSMGEQEKQEVKAKLFGKEGGAMQAENFNSYMKESASNAVSNALFKVFLEKKSESIDSEQLKWELEEKAHFNKYNTSEGKKYKVRVTDRKSNVTYVRYATRQKISELRAKGLEVEMTEYGTPYEGERTKGEKTAEVLSKSKKPNDGNLANNYPPYDKVTRGDVVAGRLGKDQMGGKNVKEDFLGEVAATANLPQTDEVNPNANQNQIDFTTKKNKIVVNPTDNSQTKLMSHHEMEGNVIVENGYSKFLKTVHALQEKAESEQQQKLFGLALSVKRRETPRSEVSDEVLKIVDTMSEKEIRKFAKTKHEGIPQKKVQKEEVSCGEKEEDKVDRRPLATAINLAKNKARAMGAKNPIVMVASENIESGPILPSEKGKRVFPKGQEPKRTGAKLPPLQNAHYEMDGELVDEARASEKRGMGSPETPLEYPGRKVKKSRGEQGGRHYQSGGEGGSRTERGMRNVPRSKTKKQPNEPESQVERLRRLSSDEQSGKYIKMQQKKRDIGSRFD
jgi:hypothetical protein